MISASKTFIQCTGAMSIDGRCLTCGQPVSSSGGVHMREVAPLTLSTCSECGAALVVPAYSITPKCPNGHNPRWSIGK